MTKTNYLMLYKRIITVCNDIHKKPINALCAGNAAELLNVTAGRKDIALRG
jgi:hypothetical protein